MLNRVVLKFLCSCIIHSLYSTQQVNSQLFGAHPPFRAIRPCPRHYESNPKLKYCLNGGKCYATIITPRSFSPFCKCAPNYHGLRCEYLFDSTTYGYNTYTYTVSDELEHKALSTVAVILFLFLSTLAWCLLILHRRIIMTEMRMGDSTANG